MKRIQPTTLVWLSLGLIMISFISCFMFEAWGALPFAGSQLATVFFVGLAGLLSSFVWLLVLRFKKPEALPSPRFPILGFVGLSVAVLLNAGFLLAALPFLRIPSGEHIRPMWWAALVFLAGAAGGLIALPASLSSLLVDKKKRFGVVGAVLSLGPIPLGIVLLHGIATIKGFYLAP